MRANDRKIPCLRGRGCTPYEGAGRPRRAEFCTECDIPLPVFWRKRATQSYRLRNVLSTHTRNSSYSTCECSAAADQCLSDRPATLKHRIPFERMQASVRERITRSLGCNGSLLGIQCPKQMNVNSDCCSFALDGSP